jgi:hypothetical protein
VNRGKKKGQDCYAPALDSSPDSSTWLRSYGHFFRPPGDVSLFCPGAHLPVGLVSGLPLPGVTVCAANATPENDIVSANISAANNNEMRLRIGPLSSLIVSHPVAPPG